MKFWPVLLRWKMLLPLVLCCCDTAAGAAPSSMPAFEVLWQNRGNPRLLDWRTFDANGKPLQEALIQNPPVSPHVEADSPFRRQVPLGSLWKLFVYLWLVENKHLAPDYVCSGARGDSRAARIKREEELYCCEPGQSIDRDAALVRSCGLFFAPERLGITADGWRTFWTPHSAGAPWLADLSAMKPETKVTPVSLINALANAPAAAQKHAANTLLARALDPKGSTAGLAQHMGGQLRVKTFSWFYPDKTSPSQAQTVQNRYGGGAGWLIDGTPVWFAGNGTGQQVMTRYGKTLADTLPKVDSTLPAGCVMVDFFSRYPLTRLEKPGGEVAAEGLLNGRYIAVFENGVTLPFTARGEMRLLGTDQDRPRIEARLGINDYVARVIDREADAKETEAARALAIVIRSYLLNEAERRGNCLFIDDDSRKQRVSPNPGSKAARAAASFTTGLVLTGAPVGYHSSVARPNRMAWTEAVAASRAGKTWDVILRQAYPNADLAAMHDPTGVSCSRFVLAEQWLATRAVQWQRLLERELPGFEAPAAPQICILAHGVPFSEQERNRIHLRALKSSEDRITLAHEYLHLGLRHHPSGHDEALIETWARRLIGENHVP